MTDPADFYKKIMADPDTATFMKSLHDKAQSYDEDKDKFLNYLMGALSGWYTSIEMVIANIESIKVMLILNSLDQGMTLYQETRRKGDKSYAAKPV